jgi:hypothetical protein
MTPWSPVLCFGEGAMGKPRDDRQRDLLRLVTFSPAFGPD